MLNKILEEKRLINYSKLSFKGGNNVYYNFSDFTKVGELLSRMYRGQVLIPEAERERDAFEIEFEKLNDYRPSNSGPYYQVKQGLVNNSRHFKNAREMTIKAFIDKLFPLSDPNFYPRYREEESSDSDNGSSGGEEPSGGNRPSRNSGPSGGEGPSGGDRPSRNGGPSGGKRSSIDYYTPSGGETSGGEGPSSGNKPIIQEKEALENIAAIDNILEPGLVKKYFGSDSLKDLFLMVRDLIQNERKILDNKIRKLFIKADLKRLKDDMRNMSENETKNRGCSRCTSKFC